MAGQQRILNITNGDSAVHLMQDATIPGEYLPWRDVLHDGPVPADLTLSQLSKVRARFIAERGWAELAEVERDFTERDRILMNSVEYDRIILWFEHDLYDQLQILQILDWFADHPPEPGSLSMICTERYLGMCSPDQLAALREFEAPITREQFLLAKRAWRAFRSADPLVWQAFLQEDTSALPFLAGAVLRQLQEYPDCRSGLSLTAQRALRVLNQGARPPGRLFGEYMELEARRFMGDLSFWDILQEMLDCDPPLLKLPDGRKLDFPPNSEQVLTLTEQGEAVLKGLTNWLDLTSTDRWIGGVHLAPGNYWCWHSGTKQLVSYRPGDVERNNIRKI
ncbi:MAG: hypothetical protein QNJ78_03660 [Gammaproteobacteria bacterium]|nr:hypothetical protein [Gammaproteobacteria bacterium]